MHPTYENPIEWQHRRLQPIFAKLGYTVVRRSTHPNMSGTFRYEYVMPEGFPKPPSIQLYATDAYPSERNEAFLHVWNHCGCDGKNVPIHVAEALKRAGIGARVTTFQKRYGVRFASTYEQYQQERKPVDNLTKLWDTAPN
jgi:hypothetical protein